MKARDIKKKLLDDYECATLEYKQLAQFRDKAIDDQQVKIRVLEQQLYELFGVKKELSFSRAARMEKWNADMSDTLSKIAKKK